MTEEEMMLEEARKAQERLNSIRNKGNEVTEWQKKHPRPLIQPIPPSSTPYPTPNAEEAPSKPPLPFPVIPGTLGGPAPQGNIEKAKRGRLTT